MDNQRIDGTRVYILNLLKYFGQLDNSSQFVIYHKKEFNPELTPPGFPNYKIVKKFAPCVWTQTRFALGIWKENPDVLWMPVHSLPFIRKKKMKTVVTIHDLAFKFFPDHFPKKDLFKINLFTDYAVRHADKLIAISESTKKDILKLYPKTDPNKIRVIYHGFDSEVFSGARDIKKENEIKKKLEIGENYILYAGALQPRKNLETLISAFEILKKEANSDLQLVLAGEKAWLSEKIVKKAQNSPFSRDIKMPGKLKFCDVGHLYRAAGIYVYPSLYEGFGIPVLEAFAAQIPVITADNSSLREVAGEAALYFNTSSAPDLAGKMKEILTKENLRQELISKGLEQIKKFSWSKCAQETLEYLKS